MTFQPPFTLEAPLDENISFSKDPEQFLEQITNEWRKAAKRINEKERGFYPEEYEILNDQRFYTVGDPQTYRSVFRKVFPFGAIAAGATLVIPHLITGITEFTNITGTLITAVPDNRPLPYTDTLLVTNQVSVLRNGANIIIMNGATAPNVVAGLCIAEFLKQ